MLDQDAKEWIERAIDKGVNRLEIQKSLKKARYPKQKIKEFIEEYESQLQTKEAMEEIGRDIKEEEKFEGNVKKFLDGNKKELSWKERREVKTFIKNAKNYSKTMKIAISKFEEELEHLRKQFGTDKINNEMNTLKLEMIDRIMESKSILEIEHPITKEEINRENAKELTFKQIVDLMKENVDEIDKVVNGKISNDEE